MRGSHQAAVRCQPRFVSHLELGVLLQVQCWRNLVPCGCKTEIPTFLLTVGPRPSSALRWYPSFPATWSSPQHGSLLLQSWRGTLSLHPAKTESYHLLHTWTHWQNIGYTVTSLKLKNQLQRWVFGGFFFLLSFCFISCLDFGSFFSFWYFYERNNLFHALSKSHFWITIWIWDLGKWSQCLWSSVVWDHLRSR